MLITLLAIAIASLAAAPVVIPAVRRLSEKRPSEHQELDGFQGDKSLEHSIESLSDEEKKKREEAEKEAERVAMLMANPHPNFSLEMIRPSPKGATAKPLVEVIWQSPGALDQKPGKVIHLDAVERVRRTPSADSLFGDTLSPDSNRKVLESANPDEPPRLISPKPIAKPPLAAQQVKAVSFLSSEERQQEDNKSEPTEGSVKSYSVHSEKFKMRPIADQGGSRKSVAIPMIIAETPSAIKLEQKFEVIKPSKQVTERRFSLLDPPEEIAFGERSWRGVQPLYIDFSPFFSLDSLIEITPGTERLSTRSSRAQNKARERRRSKVGKRSESRQSKGKNERERRETEGLHQSLLRDLNAERERMRYVHDSLDEPDASIDDSIDTDELEWSQLEVVDKDELEDVPEWQSLLSLSSNFLFDLKLSQRSKSAHHSLTEQSLEESLVFKITSGPSGPKIESKNSETADQASTKIKDH